MVGLSKRIQYQVQQGIDDMRGKLDLQLADYINRLDGKGTVTIGNIRVPDAKRQSIRNALVSFQGKVGQSKDEEYAEWLEHLEGRLQDHNCIVCLAVWQESDSIVVCQYCKNGGHEHHMRQWVEQRHVCPLCRQQLGIGNLARLMV